MKWEEKEKKSFLTQFFSIKYKRSKQHFQTAVIMTFSERHYQPHKALISYSLPQGGHKHISPVYGHNSAESIVVINPWPPDIGPPAPYL